MASIDAIIAIFAAIRAHLEYHAQMRESGITITNVAFAPGVRDAHISFVVFFAHSIIPSTAFPNREENIFLTPGGILSTTPEFNHFNNS